MNMVFGSLIFSAILVILFGASCICVICINQKVEAENIELKKKLEIIQRELNLILNDYNYRNED